MFVFLFCSLLLILFIQVSMSEYWELSSQSTSASKNTSRRSARPASTIFVNFDMSGVCYDTGARLSDVSSRLLQRRFRRGSNGYHSQVAASANTVTRTRKSDRGLKQLIHSELHWLDAPERIKYKLSLSMRRCLDGTVPQYLAAHCTPVSATASRHHLRSAASHQFVVPSYRLSSYGRRAFSVAGPMIWNSLPRHLGDPIHTISVFGRRHFSLQSTNVCSALEVFGIGALYKFTFCLLTYLSHCRRLGDWVSKDRFYVNISLTSLSRHINVLLVVVSAPGKVRISDIPSAGCSEWLLHCSILHVAIQMRSMTITLSHLTR